MATPPTRVQLVQPTVGFLSTATPKVTPTFDVVAGDLLVCIVQIENGNTGAGSTTLPLPTWTGTGTWTQKVVAGNVTQNAGNGANNAVVAIFTCDVTATATGRTVSVATANSANMYGFTVTQWRDHGGVGNTASAFVATPTTGTATTALTTSAANSAAQMGDCDWTAQDGTTRVFATVNGSAMTESLYARNTTNYGCYGAYSPDAGAAGSKTVGVTTPGAQTYAVAGIEIKGTTGPPFDGYLVQEDGTSKILLEDASGALVSESFVPPAGTQYPASGTVTATTDSAGSINARLVVSGGAPSSTTVAGSAGYALASSGTVASSTTAVGAVNATHILSGSVASTSAAIGDAPAIHPLSGSVAGASVTTGAVNAIHVLSGTVAGTGAAIGDAPAIHPLSGSVGGTTAVSGNPVLPGISGTATSTSTVTGTPNATHYPTGTVSATSSTSGAIGSNQIVGSTVVATSAVSGTAVNAVLVSGSITSTTAVSGGIAQQLYALLGSVAGSSSSVVGSGGTATYYRAWPSTSGPGAGFAANDGIGTVLGIEFWVSQDVTFTGWRFWQADHTNQTVYFGLYQMTGATTGTLLTSVGPVDLTTTFNWNYVAATTPVTVVADGSHYRAVVFSRANDARGDGSLGLWYTHTNGYFNSGIDAAITNGPLNVPDYSTTLGNLQGSFNEDAGLNALTPTNSDFQHSNYWIDPEVSQGSAGGGGLTQLLAVSGIVTATSTVSGNPVLPGAAGTVTATTGVAGSIKALHAVTGTTVYVSSLTSDSSIQYSVAGSVAAASTATGSVSFRATVSGTVTATSAAIGDAPATHPISGSTAAASNVSGNPQPPGTNGQVVATTTVAGSVTATHVLSGTAAATSTATGNALASHPVSGTAVAAVSTTTGTANRNLAVAGIETSQTFDSGAVTLLLPSMGTAGAVSSATGAATRFWPVNGGSASFVGVSGEIAVIHSGTAASGPIASVSTVAGNAQWQHRLPRDLQILGTTVPVSGWSTSPPTTGWVVTTPKGYDITLTPPASGWSVTVPST